MYNLQKKKYQLNFGNIANKYCNFHLILWNAKFALFKIGNKQKAPVKYFQRISVKQHNDKIKVIKKYSEKVTQISEYMYFS